MSQTNSAATRPIRLAARELQDALRQPPTAGVSDAQREARIREAKDWLLKAAGDQERDAAATRNQYFAALAGPAPQPQTAAEALDGIVSDVQIGQVLIAAGQAVGETQSPAGPAVLDAPIMALEQKPDFAGQMIQAMNFAAAPTSSDNLADALKTFASSVDETVQTFVSQARDAGKAVLDNLLKLDLNAAAQALAKLGGPFTLIPAAGAFLTKGKEKIEQAMNTLTGLLTGGALDDFKQKLTAAWNKLTDGTFIDTVLAWAFDKAGIDAAVQLAVANATLAVTTVDNATDLLSPLDDGFQGKMNWVKTLAGLVAGVGTVLLLLAHIAAGPLAVGLAGAYLLMLAAIVIIGRDYSGVKGIFHPGAGVLGVAQSL